MHGTTGPSEGVGRRRSAGRERGLPCRGAVEEPAAQQRAREQLVDDHETGSHEPGAVAELGARDPQVNVTGVWKVCRAIVPHMIAGKRGGAITITGSTGGLRSVAGCTHYNVAKHGCIALMHTLAWELAPEMIRVNVVHPTGVNTEMSNNQWFVDWINTHERLAGPMRGNLMPVDVVQPEDVSKMIAFLVSDDARYVTGTEVRVDAGFMLK